MDALKCDICGGSLTMDISGEFAICDSCGMKYSKEHVKAKVQEIKGTVSVEGPVKVQSTDFEIRAGVLLKYHGEATDVVIPDSVTQIGDGAFEGCGGLTSVVIPNSVTSIGNSSFSGCSSLKSIAIPDSVTSIGGNAFVHCSSLVDVTIPSGVNVTNIKDWGQISYLLFTGCSSLMSVTIPNGTTVILEYAFSGCTNLENIIIPNSVRFIGNCAFSGCSKLTNVIIPDGVNYIGNYAFSDCGRLANLRIPVSVTKIGYNAFENCTSLMSVTILNSKLSFEICWGSDGDSGSYDTFRGCSSLTNVNLPETWRLTEGRERELFPGTPYLDLKYNNKNKGGCYIATAVYGSYDCPQVWTLRRYRDNRLAKRLLGRAFIRCYYAISPHLVKWFGKTNWFRSLWRRRLDKLVCRLKNEGVDDTPYCDKQW